MDTMVKSICTFLRTSCLVEKYSTYLPYVKPGNNPRTRDLERRDMPGLEIYLSYLTSATSFLWMDLYMIVVYPCTYMSVLTYLSTWILRLWIRLIPFPFLPLPLFT